MKTNIIDIPEDQATWLAENFNINKWYSTEYIKVSIIYDVLSGYGKLRFSNYRGNKQTFIEDVINSFYSSEEAMMKTNYIIRQLQRLELKLLDTEYYELLHNLFVINSHIDKATQLMYKKLLEDGMNISKK